MNLIENTKLIMKIFLKTETNTFSVLAKKILLNSEILTEGKCRKQDVFSM